MTEKKHYKKTGMTDNTKTDKKGTDKKQLFIKLFLCFIAINAVVGIYASISLAKYAGSSDSGGAVQVGNFEIQPSLKVNGMNLLPESDGTYLVNIWDYGSLVFEIDYYGMGKSYLRVRVDETWLFMPGDGTQTVLYYEPSPSYAMSGMYDNRDDDGYLYHWGELSATNHSASIKIPVFQYPNYQLSGHNTEFPTHVRIMIKVDAVQFNRYKDVWNIPKLPWEP